MQRLCHKGFTLIETVVYLALFGILIGGAVTSAYALFENAGREETRAMLQQEGAFIIAKIDWALMGAQAIMQPSSAGTLLSVNGVTISLSGSGEVVIQDGLTGPSALNNSNVLVTHLSFLHTHASGNGVNPESVAASTTLTARTPQGALVSENFSTIVYVHH